MIQWLASKAGMWGIAAIGAVALAAASYSIGSSHGHASGYNKGQTDGKQSRQQEVDHLKDNVAALTTTINNERKAVADKVKLVEAEATENALRTQERLRQQLSDRDQIIRDYERTTPVEVQQACGLSIETVQALNKLIDKANGDPNEDPKHNGGATGTGASPSGADGLRADPYKEGRTNGGRSAGSDNGEDQRTLEDPGAVQAAPTP